MARPQDTYRGMRRNEWRARRYSANPADWNATWSEFNARAKQRAAKYADAEYRQASQFIGWRESSS